MIRLAAVDMDGTLLNPRGEDFRAHGPDHPGFPRYGQGASHMHGKKLCGRMEPLKEWGLSAAVACMNGAALYDRQGNLLMSRHMEYEQVGWILRCCQGLPLLFDFMTDQGSVTINTRGRICIGFSPRAFSSPLPLIPWRISSGDFGSCPWRSCLTRG